MPTRTERIPKLPLLDKVVLSVAEACAISGMGLTTIYDATKDGSCRRAARDGAS